MTIGGNQTKTLLSHPWWFRVWRFRKKRGKVPQVPKKKKNGENKETN